MVVLFLTAACRLDSGSDVPPRIVYTALPGSREDFQIYGSDEEGRHRRRITDTPGDKGEPRWSPDGTRVAFSWKTDSQVLIYLINPDGSNLTILTPKLNPPAAAAYDAPAWSPDGSQIAFGTVGGGAVYIINADGTGQRRLTPTSLIADDPDWSPDGARIAFWGMPSTGAEIYVINADGTGLRNLTQNFTAETDPAWSPDGRQIAFQFSAGGNPPRILVMDVNGENLRAVTSGKEAYLHPRWSPDGTRLAVFAQDGVWVVNVDGTNLKHIAPDRLASDPDWH